jgi:hypothetical protein
MKGIHDSCSRLNPTSVQAPDFRGLLQSLARQFRYCSTSLCAQSLHYSFRKLASKSLEMLSPYPLGCVPAWAEYAGNTGVLASGKATLGKPTQAIVSHLSYSAKQSLILTCLFSADKHGSPVFAVCSAPCVSPAVTFLDWRQSTRSTSIGPITSCCALWRLTREYFKMHV